MKKFKTESKKLLDLMINSVYTNQEIFLRELISNASDAVDKLHFMSLTDKKLDFSKESFEINVSFDKDARTITVTDNGVGMSKDELDTNLGTIAHSDSMLFKDENDEDQGNKVDIIGQFGVGFYSVFMVAKKVEVISKSYNSKDAYKWISDGIEGYSIAEATRESRGTDVILYLKDDTKDNNYSKFLEEYELQNLIKQYSNYVRYPIKMEVTKSREKEKPADAGDDYTPEWEDYKEIETINSMEPIWRRQKSKVKQEEYNEFYKSQFHDYADPAATISIHAEGALEYHALIFIPSVRPYEMYTPDYKKGLTLYTSNVLIMEKCEELVPDYFDFIRGVVDSQDLTLNISRETLQHNSQLRAISKKIESRVKKELLNMMKNKREDYEKFCENFGRSLKFHIYQSYGAAADNIQDLLMFYSANQKKMITLDEYIESVEKIDEDKEKESAKKKLENAVEGKENNDSDDEKPKTPIYYAAGENIDTLAKMPVVNTVLQKGMDVLLCTDNVDDFCMSAMRVYKEHDFKNVSSGDLGLESEEEKKKAEKVSEKNKDLFEAMQKALGDKVTKVAVATTPTDSPVRLIAEGPISFDMERTLSQMPNSDQAPKATRVLEINPKHKIFKTLQKAQEEGDNKKVKLYASVLYDQALLVENLPIEDPVEYAKNVAKLMV